MCASTKKELQEERRVPTVSLKTVLGSWLAWEGGGGWPISWLKIDAQGHDMAVFESAAEHMPRIQRVTMEIVKDTCDRMYEGAPRCSEVIKAMEGYGYKADKDCEHAAFRGDHGFDATRCEDSFTFSRNSARVVS